MATRLLRAAAAFEAATRRLRFAATLQYSNLRHSSSRQGGSHAAAATCLASGVAAAAALALQHTEGDVGCEAERNGGFRSSRFSDLPSMLDSVMPAVCKVQGAVGDRRLGGGSAFVVSEHGV